MRISGKTRVIAHIGDPTTTFKAPLIYNPYFASLSLDAAVVPMGLPGAAGSEGLRMLVGMSNVFAALITMPHKITVVEILDDASTRVKVAGSCNAVRKDPDGRLVGDMFDGEGFLRGLLRYRREVKGRSALVVGAGGVGSAISASLAGAGLARLALADINRSRAEALAGRLARHHPRLAVTVGDADPAGFDIVVNGTPLGMNPGDPLPLDPSRLFGETFVGEVVLSRAETPFLAAAKARGCTVQIGLDMLFEQIPAYLEFFGLPTSTPERLRELAGHID